MRRFLAGLLAALTLLVAPVSPAIGITDMGRPELTRLWRSTDEGDRFACTGTYIFPYISDYGSWLISAGHCSIADTAARAQSDTWRAGINWRAVINTHGEYGTKTQDIALATLPDVRKSEHKRIWLADKTPDTGRAYVHGFPAGIEEVVLGDIAPAEYNERVTALIPDGSEGYTQLIRKNLEQVVPGLRFMVVKPGHIIGGSSGSPVLDDSDRLIGIVWGVMPASAKMEIQGLPPAYDGYDVVFFTPIERVHELFKTLGVNN